MASRLIPNPKTNAFLTHMNQHTPLELVKEGVKTYREDEWEYTLVQYYDPGPNFYVEKYCFDHTGTSMYFIDPVSKCEFTWHAENLDRATLIKLYGSNSNNKETS